MAEKNIYFVNDEVELKQVLEFIDETDYGINIDKTREDVYAVVTSYSLSI
uniref:ORF L1 n=2 Tax=Ceduovirus TaxID=186532 RepID=Q7Y4M5_9CAUD|nr:L1 [Lactococcus phage 943]AAP80755.1 ORF L1 [Lactococcus phage 923]